MENLTQSRIADKGTVYSGATPDTTHPENWDGGITWITPNDLSDLKSRYIQNSERTISVKGYKNSSTHIVPPGSLVLSSRAPIGYVAIAAVECCTNQGCKSIVLKKGEVPEYHYYNLLFNVDRLKRLGEGTTFAEVSKRFIENFELRAFESSIVQQSIAHVLTTIDDAITRTEALIAKHKRIRAGLMQDLLTKGIDENGTIRSEETHKFKDSPLGRIPVEWEVKELNSLVSPIRPICYGILMPGNHVEEGVPVVKVKDIQDGQIIRSGLLYTHPRIDNQYKRSRLNGGDILMSIRGTVGRVAIVPPELTGANITQDTARIGVVNGNTAFIRAFLHSYQAFKFIQIHIGGVAVKGINLADVRRIPIPLPTNAEQDQIDSMLNESEEEINCARNNLAKLHRIKTGLMQDLLTGTVRVDALLAEAQL